ncbi:MAG: 4-hydroxy-3-methylbut-2-enyl diphosphate reductase [Muribaculaceae bacterium]|nr:4-hydroxy-3-methylbut-2-enyl diphosphate reductase [Muribaculaceae bacterium]
MAEPRVEIDSKSGFCFGVTTAIRKAEEVLDSEGSLYCLGDIVHNAEEVERLQRKGLVTITHEELKRLRGVKVLLRAHGEPPSTYRIARENNIEIIDATCPVVLQLQRRIKAAWEADRDKESQIVIYGKKGHAEVNGLVGQTAGEALVVQNVEELERLDPDRKIDLYSQTTSSLEGFREMVNEIESRRGKEGFRWSDTICRQVANRMTGIREFAESHEVVIFVCGPKSSNGKVLFEACREVNPRTYFISSPAELKPEWTAGASSIGICGATSTPAWLMQQTSAQLQKTDTRKN